MLKNEFGQIHDSSQQQPRPSDSVRLEDFSQIEVISWTEEWAHLRGGAWFANHAPKAPIALAANSTRLHHAACRAGVGVTILPCFAGEADCELICLVPPERVLSIDLWLVVHRDLSRTARVRARSWILSPGLVRC